MENFKNTENVLMQFPNIKQVYCVFDVNMPFLLFYCIQKQEQLQGKTFFYQFVKTNPLCTQIFDKLWPKREA